MEHYCRQFKIEFNFSCTENCEYEDSKPKLEIEQDGIIDITTGGFEPGSEVNIWLFSEPKLLEHLSLMKRVQ